MAPATAKSHMRSILRKLGATNRSQAIGIYLQHRRGQGSP
jgi:DNA-binding CsgD family transcriptional regulator